MQRLGDIAVAIYLIVKHHSQFYKNIKQGLAQVEELYCLTTKTATVYQRKKYLYNQAT